MATVYQREESPYWMCRFSVPGGKPVRKSTRRTNKREAQRLADQWEREALDRAQYGVSDELTLEQALGFWIRHHQNNPKAHAQTRVDKILGRKKGCRGLDPMLPFHKLSKTLLMDYQQQRIAEGVSEQTVNHEINAISAAYNLVKDDYLVRPGLTFPRFTLESTPRPLSDAEVDALLADLHPDRPIKGGRGGTTTYVPSADRWGTMMREIRQQNWDLVVCLVDTGLRLGELCAVTWDLVDTTDWTFQVERTKTKGKRTVSRRRFMRVHPTKRMREVLERRYRDRGNNPYLFSAWKRVPDGRWFRDKAPQKSTVSIRKAMDRVGINSPENVARWRRRDVRSLRDTFATRLRRKGVGLDNIQELLGHSTMTMTQKYADAGLDDISRNASEMLGL